MRRFAKPLSGVTCSEGSNPSLSATPAQAGRVAPVAQWIERQVADLKAVSSSLAGRAKASFGPSADLSALLGAASLGDATSAILGCVRPVEIVPGWATVEIDRSIGPALRAALAERDELLGAAAAIVAVGPRHRVALLEPSTEGPLAAALARHGEGWVAAYLRAGDASAGRRLGEAGFRLSPPGHGPLGIERRLLVGRRDGPFILLVDPPVAEESTADGSMTAAS